MAIQDEIPRSRLTLTYKTTVNGQTETVALPLRLMVLGDFSLGTSRDRVGDLEERALRSLDGKNLDAVMADMGMSLSIQVPNRINPDKAEELSIKLPITSLRSFTPDEIARNVPQIRALLLLKRLLLEMQSNVDNRKELRKQLQELFAKPEALKSLIKELQGFDSFKLPTGKLAGAAASDAA